jgi:hypothetical protein
MAPRACLRRSPLAGIGRRLHPPAMQTSDAGRWVELFAADRRSLAELVACLVTYNVAPDGTVTPQSVYRGCVGYSFGQKKTPSPTATALLAAVVRRFEDLTDEIADVDVMALDSSKGGSGTPIAPRTG